MMAKASIETLLSLEQYGEIMGVNPTHFQGIYHESDPYRTDVDDFLYRYAWQNYSHVGFEELALAIATAEAKIASFIGFWPAPKYEEAETVPYPRFNPLGTEMGTYSFGTINTLNRYPTVHCAWKKFIKGGRRKVDEVALNVTVTYSDVDGDGYSEVATVSVPGLTTTGWLAKEIGVYPTSDTTPTERIRGVKVSIAAGSVTIVGNSAVFVDPTQWEDVRNGEGINGDDHTVFLAKVNVYREYCSDEGTSYAPALFLYQDSTITPLAAFGATYGLLQPYNKERSVVSLINATWDATQAAWVAETCPVYWPVPPHLVQMYYQAGADTDAQGRMQPLLARAVAALATALLTKPVISQGPPENLMHYWQSIPPEGAVSYGTLSCPWGTRYGALEAYGIARDTYAEGLGTASV